MIKRFINEYLIPEIDSEIVDGEYRKIIYQAINEAEKNYEEYKDMFIRRLLSIAFGFPGIILNSSKSDNNIIYNSNILVGNKKYWFGDFRLNNKTKLDDISQLLEEPIYLLREMDARFETEDNPNIDKAVYVTKPY